ncbi:sulfurtransferase TusA family protein [Afifella marina]|uniref:tRNA 2-thiouridine synthesizing protein A n=1 Tax=Afifella marina DSM 2698 TaxID=1120955 RepID=A0A1G5M5F9_AFIMA|nr:sulfurtransferase TusA family protein [Afifella marina]MBK1622956.1 SirA family protein [Afifella marina DSM 2698]MBK1625950.1 SirA family protein [Afifella marina]MBK5917774.1 SirA family protein [Afifella marina]RAI23685.1 SirA family protein [Afifella marina DSM 2698]SCZ20316.1 tRNA 2-thiouridine synthesizing protein A [Afifella marina DSM 2698]
MADQVLDAKGLNCPLPLLRARKVLEELPNGGTLEVVATDPGTVRNFQDFCQTSGHELMESRTEGDVFTFVIKRCN